MTPTIDIESLRRRLLGGDRAALARAITLAESKRADHRALASDLIDAVLPQTGKAIRVGITGVPGVGKSTTIEILTPDFRNKAQAAIESIVEAGAAPGRTWWAPRAAALTSFSTRTGAPRHSPRAAARSRD